jgi:hypothetical protein
VTRNPLQTGDGPVLFYAKPECRGNARQIRVLETFGHDVVVRIGYVPWERRLCRRAARSSEREGHLWIVIS